MSCSYSQHLRFHVHRTQFSGITAARRSQLGASQCFGFSLIIFLLLWFCIIKMKTLSPVWFCWTNNSSFYLKQYYYSIIIHSLAQHSESQTSILTNSVTPLSLAKQTKEHWNIEFSGCWSPPHTNLQYKIWNTSGGHEQVCGVFRCLETYWITRKVNLSNFKTHFVHFIY